MSYQDLCDNCRNKPCCNSFAAPLVFSTDLRDLKKIGKGAKDFLDEVVIQNKTIKKIKKKSNSTTCIFFDEQNIRCSIYQNRPFDCKIYPFDIYLIDGKYRWILYSCNPESNWEWTEEHLQNLENDPQFEEIMENIDIYSDLTEINSLENSARPQHVVLREVNRKPKSISRESKNILLLNEA